MRVERKYVIYTMAGKSLKEYGDQVRESRKAPNGRLRILFLILVQFRNYKMPRSY